MESLLVFDEVLSDRQEEISPLSGQERKEVEKELRIRRRRNGPSRQFSRKNFVKPDRAMQAHPVS